MSGIVAQNINRHSGLIKAPEAGGGAWTFIKKLTASGDDDLSFVNGTSDVVLDSTYKEYIFYFKNIHPSDDDKHLQFNVSIDAGSNYNVAKTTTMYLANHSEADAFTTFSYLTSLDLAQGTGIQHLTENTGNDNDQSCSGYLHLFDPSSTTFVKHFIAVIHNCRGSNQTSESYYTAGYANTTSAVDAIQFIISTGTVDLGDIILHGLKT